MAADFFLKLEGIKGNSVKDGHEGEIEIESFGFSVSSTGSFHSGGTGAGEGKASISDLSFSKFVDPSSPQLFQAVAQGRHIKSAVITSQKIGGDSAVQNYVITLTDVLVSSFQNAGGGGAKVSENFTLNFAKIEFAYKDQSNEGANAAAVNAGFNAATGKSV